MTSMFLQNFLSKTLQKSFKNDVCLFCMFLIFDFFCFLKLFESVIINTKISLPLATDTPPYRYPPLHFRNSKMTRNC
eukprot:UN12325